MIRTASHNLTLLQTAISHIYLKVKLGAGFGTLLGKLHIRDFDT